MNGFIPDYAKVTGDKVGVEECKNMLSSSEEGIYNLFNLIKMQEGNENGKLLNYISSVVLKVSLKG